MQEVRRLPEVKRDMELVRNILKMIEENPKADNHHEVKLGGFHERTYHEVVYHLELLVQAGFIRAIPGELIAYGLTWDGHEFLANIKNDGIWEKTKEQFTSLPDVGLKIVAAVAEKLVMKQVGL